MTKIFYHRFKFTEREETKLRNLDSIFGTNPDPSIVEKENDVYDIYIFPNEYWPNLKGGKWLL